MRDVISFVKMTRWPAIFAGLVLLTHDGLTSAIVVLALAFRPDLSVALRRRRVTVQAMGVKGCIDHPPDGPG